MMAESATHVELYTAPDGATILEIRADAETVWLTRQQLAAVIGAIYQGLAGADLYPTAEEKAANLLYLIVKDHPLSDGNKRSAAALFVTFLSKNGLLDGGRGIAINNSALAAITLLVAMSDPKEKELMIALDSRMISEPLI